MKKAKKQIIEYGKLCGLKGYSAGRSGNISVRVKDKIVITTSGSANGYLDKNDLTTIDFSGNSLEKGKKASSEKMLHAEFYKRRTDINAIIHVHSPYLSAFASAGKALDEPVMAENVFYFDYIPLADYALPSTLDLVINTSKHFDKFDVVLMANHGVIVGGANIKDAYLKLELAETYAETVFHTKLLGGAVLLNDKEVAAIEALKA